MTAAAPSPPSDDPLPAGRLAAIQAGAPGVGATVARLGLTVLSWGWGAVQAAKAWAYRLGLRRAVRLDVPVVSVGNLAVGGTGKTPFVAWLAARMRAEGHAPGLLARGYGRAPGAPEGLNDEGLVLRHLLGPDVPQRQAADRVAAGRTLRAAHPEVDVLLLDDGFQHRRLHRDVDVVLLDATRPLGHGHLLPRGLLREGPAALRRADAVVLTRTERVDAAALARTRARVAPWLRGPLALARAEPQPTAPLDGRRVFVLCGLGNPDAFLGTVRDLGAEIVGRRLLRDHEALPADAWPALLAEARAAGAAHVVLTRKDAVKVETLPPEVVVVDQAFVVHEGQDALLDVVRAAFASADGRAAEAGPG